MKSMQINNEPYTELQADNTGPGTTALQQVATVIQQVARNQLRDACAHLDSLMDYQGKVGIVMLRMMPIRSLDGTGEGAKGC